MPRPAATLRVLFAPVYLAPVVLALGVPGAAGETRVGGLAVSRVPPPAHVAVPALDETGCRVAMLVARCRDGAVSLIWAFDMEIAAGTEAALGFALQLPGDATDGPTARPPWPLSANRRTAEIPSAPAQALIAALPAGGVAVFVLDDPASGSVLQDRFDLAAFGAALADLACPTP